MTSSISGLVESLVGNIEPTPEQIPMLSDIDRDAAAELRAAWPGIDTEIRASVLTQAIELSIDDVSLDFTALAKIALDDPDPEVRRLAVEALWESEETAIGERLLKLLEDEPDVEVRVALAAALRPFVLLREFEQIDARLGDAIVGGLQTIATDTAEPPNVRAVALESLGGRSLPAVTRLIEAAYDDDDMRMQLAAIRAMGSSADERWVDYLTERMQSADPEFREEAAMAAGSIASEDALEGLIELLDDEVPAVVMATIDAMGEIGGEEALRVLEELREEAVDEYADAIDAAVASIRDLAFSTGDGR